MKTNIKLFVLSIAMTTLPSLFPSLVLAQITATKTEVTTQNGTPLSEGEIKKVNVDTRQLTIQHGPLANLHMPGMTMAFKVKDAAMLQQVKPGDKVRMLIEKVDGALTVTTLQKQF